MHIAGGVHEPQDPPHWSSPHCLPSQAGVQTGSTHFWAALHVETPPHVPHDPPQPSAPQSLFLQSGWQTHFPFWHAWPAAHDPQDPPHPSAPHALVPQAGVHVGPGALPHVYG